MSEMQPHINPWAEKLQQATLPEVGPAWMAMEVLLDREMPVREKKDRRRWLLLILLLLLIIGICNCPGRRRLFGDRLWKGGVGDGVERPATGPAQPTTSPGRNPAQPAKSPGQPTKNPAQPAKSPGQPTKSPAQPAKSPARPAMSPARPATAPAQPVDGPAQPAMAPSRPAKQPTQPVTDPAPHATAPTPPATAPTLPATAPTQPATAPVRPATSSGRASGGAGRPENAKTSGQPGLTASTTRMDQPGVIRNAPEARRNGLPNSSGRKVARPGKPGSTGPQNGEPTQNETTQRSVTRESIRKPPALQDGVSKQPTVAGSPQRKPATSDSARKTPEIADSVPKKTATPDSTRKRPYMPDSTRKKPYMPDSTRKRPYMPDSTRKKPLTKDSTRKKPPTPPKEEDDKETEKGFVAAIGFNQFFPIGGQQVSDFNSGGITGALGDYIPVPVGRYYFNKKFYVQLEVQFNAPQYTKKDLMIKPAKPDTLGPNRVQNSTVTIKKLLYFNVPLSLHYVPVDGLSLGAGLQFSRLRNAFGSFDTTITNTVFTPVDSVVGKREATLKGSTVYQNISTNEFRILFDLNYTYKHFILGMRYNRALSNFINVQVGSGNVTQSRNNSLQLYLRYILFDGRKKKPDRAERGPGH